MLNTWQSTALLAAAAFTPSALAGGLRMERRRPPGAPSAEAVAQLGQLSQTPKEALAADGLNIDSTQSSLLGPHAFVPRPDAASTIKGRISLTAADGAVSYLADADKEGQPVWSLAADGFGAGTFTFPATACAALPSAFSIWGILSQYSGLPYLGLTTYTAAPAAPATIALGGAGYAFLTPANQTAARTYAQSSTALGSPFTGESAVWSLDCATKEVTAAWTAADGSQVPVAFVAWSADGLVATADVGAFQAQFARTPAPLTFKFEPTSAGAFWGDVVVKVAEGATGLPSATGVATEAAVPTAAATDAADAAEDDPDEDASGTSDDDASAPGATATPFSAAAGTVPAATNKAQSKSISKSLSKSLSKSKSVSKSLSRSASKSLSRSKSVSKSVSRSASRSASRAASVSAAASKAAAKASSSLSKAQAQAQAQQAKATLAVRRHAGKKRASH